MRLHWLMHSPKEEDFELLIGLPPNFSEAFSTSLKSPVMIQVLEGFTFMDFAKS